LLILVSNFAFLSIGVKFAISNLLGNKLVACAPCDQQTDNRQQYYWAFSTKELRNVSKRISKAATSKKATGSKKDVPTKKSAVSKSAPTKKVSKAAAPKEKPSKKAAAGTAKKSVNSKKALAVAVPETKVKATRVAAEKKEVKAAVKRPIVAPASRAEKEADRKHAAVAAVETKDAPVAEVEVKEIDRGPIYRYSDEELNEFRELIMSRLEVGRKELVYMQGQMLGKDGTGAEDNADRRLSIEDGSGAMDREQLSLLASRQLVFINNLEKALIRIMNKTYGICRETGKLIEKARLRAVPHATLSMEAKTKGKK
jgi:RNA polymerase-binding transcription factor DksA